MELLHGYERIAGTEFPVISTVTKSGRKWLVTERLCNSTPRGSRTFKTKVEALFHLGSLDRDELTWPWYARELHATTGNHWVKSGALVRGVMGIKMDGPTRWTAQVSTDGGATWVNCEGDTMPPTRLTYRVENWFEGALESA